MKSPIYRLTTALTIYLVTFVDETHAFGVNPSVEGHSFASASSTALFPTSGIIERTVKAPQKKKRVIKKTKGAVTSIDEATESSVGSLILLLNDPHVRHKVRRRPLLISHEDKGKPKRKAMRAFQEGQELARLAVREVLKEYNINDVSV
ncbi:hypothetical protein FisN_18Hu304 [Fistulifera solaris]|uniref:RxLR effector candidate protein n=1 Tax=Fistulifera solaris TaxID=1519565 RepID=A0A1Z5KIQ4_FISSO|nr:hypothetical protein FisN_18Hu304 [Fistulifera solaris]|eukprot:GAX26184.1 hypothetical protein FisN_18Hu304 [Fistulifera solaris]